MTIHQGDCIRLQADADPTDPAPADHPAPSGTTEQLYQVIAVDQGNDRCWLRRWPLARQGSPVFEISLRQVQRGPQPRPCHS